MIRKLNTYISGHFMDFYLLTFLQTYIYMYMSFFYSIYIYFLLCSFYKSQFINSKNNFNYFLRYFFVDLL